MQQVVKLESMFQQAAIASYLLPGWSEVAGEFVFTTSAHVRN